MSRYLNSSKIGVLILVQMYADSLVPTQAALPVLSFVIDHLLPPDTSQPSSWSESPQLLTSLDDLKRLTQPLASAQQGNSLWDSFVEELWKLESFDALNEFFDRLSRLLVAKHDAPKEEEEKASSPTRGQILLSHDSPIGFFVRKSQIEFLRLPFHDATALWASFVRFRRPSYDDWRKSHPAAGGVAFDVNLDLESLGWSHPLVKLAYGGLESNTGADLVLVPPADADHLLRFQIEVMQRTGGLVPQQLVQQFQSMLSPRKNEQPLVEYVKFIRAWRSGDQATAFDCLHRYFDYTMHSMERTLYQYALLNLAVMQADLGSLQEAVAAIQETIKTARDNQDAACLNFALSWLYQVMKARPGQKPLVDKMGMIRSEREGLEYVRTKAKESGQWSLCTSTLLREAELMLLDGDSMASALEKLARASSLNVSQHLYSNMGQQILLQSSIYGRLGLTQLAEAQMELFRGCFESYTTYEEQVRALCRSVYLRCQRGDYDDGMMMLRSIPKEKLDVLRIAQYVSIYLAMLRMHHYLMIEDVKEAKLALSSLQGQPILDQDVKFELDMMQIDLLLKEQNTKPAFEKVVELDLEQQTHFSIAGTTDLDITHRVRLMIKKAELWHAISKPEHGFSVALRACSLAYRTKSLAVLWEAAAVLSRVLNAMGEHEAAFQLLEVVIPRVLELEDPFLAARCWSIRVDSHVGIANKRGKGSTARYDLLTKACEGCDRAAESYERVGNVGGQADMMSKKSLIQEARERRSGNDEGGTTNKDGNDENVPN